MHCYGIATVIEVVKLLDILYLFYSLPLPVNIWNACALFLAPRVQVQVSQYVKDYMKGSRWIILKVISLEKRFSECFNFFFSSRFVQFCAIIHSPVCYYLAKCVYYIKCFPFQQVLGAVGKLPDIYVELEISYFLLRRLLGVRTEGDKRGARVIISVVLCFSLCCNGCSKWWGHEVDLFDMVTVIV